VQDFGQRTFHACALPGGEDNHGKRHVRLPE
jgi:hypothetical protein